MSEYDDLEENASTAELIESDPERFVAFPQQDSHRGYDEMVDFTDDLKNEELKKALSIALNGHGAFRRFKDVLLDYPKEQESWFSFEDERRRERFEQWIQDEGLKIIDIKANNLKESHD